MRWWRPVIMSVTAAILVLAVSPLHAQEIDCEKLNFAELTALLTEAQAKAASGDNAGALELAAQVQAQLTAIQKQCADAGKEVKLSETYNGDLFSFQYPAGFEVGEGSGMFRSEPDYTFVVFVNDPSITKAMQDTVPVARGSRLISVGVGTVDATVRAIGAFSASSNYRKLSMVELMKLVVKDASAPMITFGEVIPLTINEAEAASVFFSVKNRDQIPTADAYLLFVKLPQNQIVSVVGITAAHEGEQFEPILRAVAGSVVVKS